MDLVALVSIFKIYFLNSPKTIDPKGWTSEQIQTRERCWFDRHMHHTNRTHYTYHWGQWKHCVDFNRWCLVYVLRWLYQKWSHRVFTYFESEYLVYPSYEINISLYLRSWTNFPNLISRAIPRDTKCQIILQKFRLTFNNRSKWNLE